MIFEYEGITKDGKRVSGQVQAGDYEKAIVEVYDAGIANILSLRKASATDQIEKDLNRIKDKLLARIKQEDLIIFTKQFATMFDAGVDVSTILDRLHKQTKNPKLKEIVSDIKDKVTSGVSLSDAFKDHEHVFSPLYVSMLKVGEESGELAPILNRLSKILENELSTKRKIKSATRYPKIVLGALVVAFTVIVTFVLPKFMGMFKFFGAKLPLPTIILMKVEYFFTHYWHVVILMILAGIFAYKKYKATPSGKRQIDKVSLKLPVIGPLVYKIHLSRLLRILGLLYRSGISITDALRITSGITNNTLIQEAVEQVREEVESGSTVSAPMRETGFFPDMVCDMIAVGEDTGSLDEMLMKVADYYDEEVDYAISNLSQAIEPILLIFVAGIVVVLALGVFLPMWNMFKVVH